MQNLRILDYGCGNGGFDEILPFDRAHFGSWLQLYGNSESVGIDIDAKAIAKAKNRIKNGTYFLTTNGRGVPFLNDWFDQVHMFGVLHHADNPRGILKELHRVTKPGGTLIMTESVDNYLPLRISRRIIGSWQGHPIESYFNCKKLIQMVQKYYVINRITYCWRPTVFDILRMYHLEPEFVLPIWESISVVLRHLKIAEHFCVHVVIEGVKRPDV